MHQCHLTHPSYTPALSLLEPKVNHIDLDSFSRRVDPPQLHALHKHELIMEMTKNPYCVEEPNMIHLCDAVWELRTIISSLGSLSVSTSVWACICVWVEAGDESLKKDITTLCRRVPAAYPNYSLSKRCFGHSILWNSTRVRKCDVCGCQPLLRAFSLIQDFKLRCCHMFCWAQHFNGKLKSYNC